MTVNMIHLINLLSRFLSTNVYLQFLESSKDIVEELADDEMKTFWRSLTVS